MRLDLALTQLTDPTHLSLVLFGDRIVAAAVQRRRVETFVVDAEQPSMALRAELEQRKLAPRTVALGLPRASVTVKRMELPTVQGDVREMVRFELERHVPFPSEDAPFDFIPLIPETEGTGTGGGRQVLLVASERRVLDGALRIVEEAQLRTTSVTVASHDLAALVTFRRRERVVWVHRVGEGAELLFFSGGALALSRSLPSADDALVVEEIRRSFGVTRWRGCDAVWLSGDFESAAESELDTLGAPVSAPPFTARAQARLETITEVDRGARELAIAVASAGRGRPLDLLPMQFRPRRVTRDQAITAGAVAATVVLAVAALMAPGYRETRRLAAANTSIARLDREVRGVEQVLQELDRRRRLLSTIDALDRSSFRPLPVLRELTELMPQDAWLTTLTLDTKGVELTGQAAAASALIPILENSSRFERVEFASPVTRGRDREQFRIRAAWEGPPQGAAVQPAAGTPPGPGRARPRRPGPPPTQNETPRRPPA